MKFIAIILTILSLILLSKQNRIRTNANTYAEKSSMKTSLQERIQRQNIVK